MDFPKFIVCNQKEESISIRRVIYITDGPEQRKTRPYIFKKILSMVKQNISRAER